VESCCEHRTIPLGACAWVPHLDVCALCAPASFQTPALFALLPVLGVRPPCLVFRPPVVVRVRVLLCYDLCHMSPPGLRPRAAASAVPPVAHPAGSPVDPAAARLSGLSPAAAPFSPAPTAFSHGTAPSVLPTSVPLSSAPGIPLPTAPPAPAPPGLAFPLVAPPPISPSVPVPPGLPFPLVAPPAPPAPVAAAAVVDATVPSLLSQLAEQSKVQGALLADMVARDREHRGWLVKKHAAKYSSPGPTRTTRSSPMQASAPLSRAARGSAQDTTGPPRPSRSRTMRGPPSLLALASRAAAAWHALRRLRAFRPVCSPGRFFSGRRRRKPARVHHRSFPARRRLQRQYPLGRGSLQDLPPR